MAHNTATTTSSMFFPFAASTARWSSSNNIITYSLLTLLAYPLLARTLRFRRRGQLRRKYPFGQPNGQPLSVMTLSDAQKIMKELSDLEFPAFFELGLQFALFRTYGIPTISELLCKTRQLTDSDLVSKRYADTTVLVSEIYTDLPFSKRSASAFARLNYLHGNYIKAGKISNDDMLYTLSLFMRQPKEWIGRYEWREFEELEICAVGLFHYYMGRAMEIDFSTLPSGIALPKLTADLSPDDKSAMGNWRDGLHFYRELDAWSRQYEERVMLPDKRNYDTAIKTREYLLMQYPSFMRGTFSNILASMMDDRLREAIMFDKASAGYYGKAINAFLGARKFYLRWLALPRIWPSKYMSLETHKDANGTPRRYLEQWTSAPHYVKPTIMNRYGPGAWMSRLLGNPVPGDDGMQPEGYSVPDVGPRSFEGKGRREFEDTKGRLWQETGAGMCPFMIK